MDSQGHTLCDKGSNDGRLGGENCFMLEAGMTLLFSGILFQPKRIPGRATDKGPYISSFASQHRGDLGFPQLDSLSERIRLVTASESLKTLAYMAMQLVMYNSTSRHALARRLVVLTLQQACDLF